ncbi:hypothetical protein C7T35_17320 [Variovorax sp. WS11]|uniref:hypothetical protein n=1 Tax=Variovorax sp. WS11 TaxID=1105204 RepID=UPI000D0D2577|nr:hypothetical protein [Variovorax sp. WS11]NDZ15648.1 hypothetical protein [Variovorax sp. WS11]PSL83405.1 hypothetical protein C7T35_17320 [Variovorax sp. WS11]
MIITVLNMSKQIADADLQHVIRAINRQIKEDFEPYWSLGALLRLEGKSARAPDKLGLPDMRGDAVLYLWDQVDVPNALGYHDANARGIPFGFVFTELQGELHEAWTVTLSHEALELIADPLVNLLVAGPHPTEDRTVFHWYEMFDAVQDERYQVDGVDVSNFVLPLYFTPTAEQGSRNDFLGKAYEGATLASFGINPGGYIGFFDPKTEKHETYAMANDETAKRRLAAKKQLATDGLMAGRRAYRIGGWPREKTLEDQPSPPKAAARSPAVRAASSKNINIQAATLQEMALAVSPKAGRSFVMIDSEE